MGIKGTQWAWEKLGIASTSDKDAIHAAYAAKRAELDAQAMRISAFAELTEAREKALFLASELQREEERELEACDPDEGVQSEEVTAEVSPTVDVPEPRQVPESQQEAPADPEPEPEPEPEPVPERDFNGPWKSASRTENSANGEPSPASVEAQEIGDGWEHAGRYRPSYDVPEEPGHYGPQVEPGLDPNPDEEWKPAGGYIPEAEQTIDPSLIVPKPSASDEPSDMDLKIRGAVRGFFERYPIKTYWVIYGLAAFFFLRSCM